MTSETASSSGNAEIAISDDDDDVNGDVADTRIFLCSICEKGLASDNARWQHVNVEHISRRAFPSAAFLKKHGRNLCSSCGFTYSSRWTTCRCSQGSNSSRC